MSTIVICVGHSRSGDSGAVNTSGVTEHTFNSKVGRLLTAILREAGHKVHLLDKYEGNSYTQAMVWVADQCKTLGADLAIELHFNSASPLAEGHEWLYWVTSKKGKALAESFNSAFKKAFPSNKERGLKPITSGDRGGLYLRLTHCPAVILEPFFGSNPTESSYFSLNQTALAHAYAQALLNYLE